MVNVTISGLDAKMTGHKNGTHTLTTMRVKERMRHRVDRIKESVDGDSCQQTVFSSVGSFFAAVVFRHCLNLGGRNFCRRFSNFIIKCRLAMRAHLFIWQHKHILHDVKEVENYLFASVSVFNTFDALWCGGFGSYVCVCVCATASFWLCIACYENWKWLVVLRHRRINNIWRANVCKPAVSIKYIVTDKHRKQHRKRDEEKKPPLLASFWKYTKSTYKRWNKLKPNNERWLACELNVFLQVHMCDGCICFTFTSISL